MVKSKPKNSKKSTAKKPPQIKRPSAVQSNQKPTEEEEGAEESGGEDAGDADVKDASAGEGNGQGAAETQGGGETNEGDETMGGGKTKEGGEAKGGEETQTTDGHKIPAEGGETREGGEPKETGEETQSVDAHHEVPTEDQTSGPLGEGGDVETVVDGSHEAEPKAAGLDEGKDKDESKANEDSMDVGNKDGVSRQNEAGAVEVAGLTELIEAIQAMGSGVAEQPGVPSELVDRLKNTPLYPAYEALQDSWKKMLARVSEMEARPVALPPSPPLTPQTLSTISNKGQQHQHQQPSSPPSKAFKDQGTETDPPPPPSSAPAAQAPPLPPQTVATSSTKGPKDRLAQPSDPPSKEFKDPQVGTDPLPPASSTPPTQAPPLTPQPVLTNSPQDLKRRLKQLTQSSSKVSKDQQIRTDPPPPA
ncbi:hypothetical protein FS837_008616, partial [Tulasnella sp. UAMH 9824]